MAADSKPGTSKLANVLVSRMRYEKDVSLVCEFGEIQKNMSLITDSFPIPVPKGDYMVLSHVSAGRLSPGDRVLVFRLGNEAAVVVDTIQDS